MKEFINELLRFTFGVGCFVLAGLLGMLIALNMKEIFGL